ncbi:MAG: hypothetical protein WBB36_02810 [Chitinophagales bacterium]
MGRMKFHPDIIQQYQNELENNAAIKQCFKTKNTIGFGRVSEYATRYTG